MSELIYNHTFLGKAFKMSSLNEGYYGEFHRDYYDDLDLHCEEIFDEIEKKPSKKTDWQNFIMPIITRKDGDKYKIYSHYDNYVLLLVFAFSFIEYCKIIPLHENTMQLYFKNANSDGNNDIVLPSSCEALSTKEERTIMSKIAYNASISLDSNKKQKVFTEEEKNAGIYKCYEAFQRKIEKTKLSKIELYEELVNILVLHRVEYITEEEAS